MPIAFARSCASQKEACFEDASYFSNRALRSIGCRIPLSPVRPDCFHITSRSPDRNRGFGVLWWELSPNGISLRNFLIEFN